MTHTVSQSLGRVFAIMGLFRQEQRPLTAADIRRALGTPTTSTFSILREMVDLGYFDFDTTRKTYFPTGALESLCNWMPQAEAGQSKINSVIAGLVAELGETASANREHFIFTGLAYIRCPLHPFLKYSPPAGNVGAPLCQTVSGRVLLSMGTDERVRDIVRSTNRWAKVARAGFSFRADEILKVARQVREEGHLCEIDGWFPGIGVISVPVRLTDSTGKHVALAVSGAAGRIRANSKRIIRSLKAAALQLHDA